MKDTKSAVKNNRLVWWKIAIGVVVIAVLAVAAYYIARAQKRIGWLEQNLHTLGWKVVGLEQYGQIDVSDDGQWYLIHDVRVRFPYFKTVENAGLMSGEVNPLRHRVLYSIPPESEAEGFRVGLAFEAMSDMIGDSLWDEIENANTRYSELYCGEPFRIEYNYESHSAEENYKVVVEKTLADGRMVALKERITGKACGRLLGGERGEFLREQFSQMESY